MLADARRLYRGLSDDLPCLHHGRPATARKLASFEGWSDTVRSALIWLGKADCINSMETSRGRSGARRAARHVDGVVEAIGVGYEHRSTLASVIEVANRMEPAGYNQETAKRSGSARRHPSRSHAKADPTNRR